MKTTLSLSLIVISSLLLQACVVHHPHRGAHKAKHVHHHAHTQCHQHPRLKKSRCHRH